MLIEFKTEEESKTVIHSCSSHQKDVDVMALHSPFLWFRAVSGKKEAFQIPKSQLMTTKGCNSIDEDNLIEELANCEDVSEQIQQMHDRTALNDLGVRLRYMVARQVC